MMATYYRQRASAGLIITEGAPVSAVARGYSMTPGIYTPAQIEGWKKSLKRCTKKVGKYLSNSGMLVVAAIRVCLALSLLRHRQ